MIEEKLERTRKTKRSVGRGERENDYRQHKESNTELMTVKQLITFAISPYQGKGLRNVFFYFWLHYKKDSKSINKGINQVIAGVHVLLCFYWPLR